MLCFTRVPVQKTAIICAEILKQPSRIFSGVFSRSASNQSLVLAHQNYDSKESQNGSPVLIIHGMLGSKRNWHSFCKSYNEETGKRVIAVDCRNHGESPRSDHMTYPLMAGDIAETLKELNIRKTILIGHSMGGKVAMEMALSMPTTVEKLILVDITPITTPLTQVSVSMVPMVMSAMLNLDLSQVSNRKDADELLKESIPLDGLRAWVLTNLYKDKNGQFHWYVDINNVQKNKETLFDGIKLHKRNPYTGETIFIGGGESDVLRNVDINELRNMFSKAKLVMIPGAGHFVHAEKPKEFLEIVKNFLR